MIAVVVCGLVVAGVWAWQMKITFAKYAAERALHKQQMVAANDDGPVVDTDNNATLLKARLDEFKSLLEGAVLEEIAKDQVLDEVKQELTATPEVPTN